MNLYTELIGLCIFTAAYFYKFEKFIWSIS